MRADDLSAAAWLHQRASLLRWQVILSAGLLGDVGVAFSNVSPSRASLAYVVAFVVGPAVALAIGFLIAAVVVPFTARRTFRQQRSLSGAFTARWDERVFFAKNPLGEQAMPWDNYLRWRESRSTILLYHSDRLYQFMPKRVMSEAQVESMRACAAGAELRGARPSTGR